MMVLAFRYFLIYQQEHDEANKINVWYSSQGSLKNLTRPYLYADFVTSFIAFARYPTLPVVTPAILHISTIIHEKYWSVEREGGKEEGNLPYSTIASQIDMKFSCQTINLFGCHSTIAEHANLFARPETLYTTLASKQVELSNTIEDTMYIDYRHRKSNAHGR